MIHVTWMIYAAAGPAVGQGDAEDLNGAADLIRRALRDAIGNAWDVRNDEATARLEAAVRRASPPWTYTTPGVRITIEGGS